MRSQRCSEKRNRIGNIEVYTRENQALIIRIMGACEEEGICEVDTLAKHCAGQALRGNVTQIEGTYICTLNLYDVTKGNVMDTAESQAKKLLVLRDDIQKNNGLGWKTNLALKVVSRWRNPGSGEPYGNKKMAIWT